jgi:hypothetical protein
MEQAEERIKEILAAGVTQEQIVKLIQKVQKEVELEECLTEIKAIVAKPDYWDELRVYVMEDHGHVWRQVAPMLLGEFETAQGRELLPILLLFAKLGYELSKRSKFNSF